MPLLDGFPGVSGATDFGELRKLFAGLVVRNASGVPRAGILRDTNAPLVTGRADLAVDVARFPFISVRDGGAIFGLNEGTTQVQLPALPTSNKRIDILWVRQGISELGDTTDLPQFGWTTGDAAAIPVPPTTPLPAGAFEVARLQIAVGTTATNDAAKVTITQAAWNSTGLAGTPVPFPTLADLKAWTTAAPGQLARIQDMRGEWEFIPGAPGYWLPLFPVTSKYGISQNVNTGTTASVTATPVPTAGESTGLSDELFTRVAGGFNIIRAGEYEIGGPLTLHIAGTLQKLNQRIFIDVVATGIANQRLAVFGAPNEDGLVTPRATLRLAAGAQLRFNFFHSNGSTVTFAWLPFLKYCGPLV